VIPKPMPHNSGLNPPNRDDDEYNQNTIYNQTGKNEKYITDLTFKMCTFLFSFCLVFVRALSQ
jgi:hypothetical protein